MKKVYLVRHGESVGNASRTHQTSETPLAESGLEQARAIASRFQKLPVQAVISSGMQRADVTADIIHEQTGGERIVSHLFRERVRPSEIWNRSTSDPVALHVRAERNKNAHNPDYRYSDEETFSEFHNRAMEAKAFLEARPEEKLLTVSHGTFLRMLVAVMIFDPAIITPTFFYEWVSALQISNTGLTIANYEDNKWSLVTWNDHAHL